MTKMQITTGIQALAQYQRPFRGLRRAAGATLLDMIVGRFAGDDHVMHVALA